LKKLITAPAQLPIELTAIKDQLRIEHDHALEDDHLLSLAGMAKAFIEGRCQRALITQTWRTYYQRWAELKAAILPKGQLQSVTGVYYLDQAGASQTISESDYIVSGVGSDYGKIIFKDSFSYPSDLFEDYPVQVEFVCGYGDWPAAIPEDLGHIMKVMVTHYYENREPADIEDFLAGALTNYRLKEVF
jgi:uncharacterized phiE125 gp8 family phage protein